MANEMPDANQYSGLQRKVIQYAEAFRILVDLMKTREITDADWANIESLVDVPNFRRFGVFANPTAEEFGWQVYREVVTRYAAGTNWEGTLRRISEVPGQNLVFLELEERNSARGVMSVSNTVTIYKFNEAGKLRNLDVYVAPLGNRPR